ncbi:MAG TPA: preprotein translocase subunit SecG [Patescibacteria group bacterium]|nr:preprotein translocase subunit SecG [Patescibacteria group bacterium]
MKTVILIAEIITGVLLVATILLQMQGSGLSTAFGGASEFYRSKRSVEKLLLWVTVVLGVLFAAFSILLLLQK